MAKCYYCGKEVAFPYRCKYCNHLFCVEHHLPEKHNCSGLKRNLKLNNIEEIGNRCDFWANLSIYHINVSFAVACTV